MAVKVIKVKPDPKVAKRIACSNCGATLEYTPNDVKERNGRDYSGGPDGEEYINCPNCRKRAIIRSW